MLPAQLTSAGHGSTCHLGPTWELCNDLSCYHADDSDDTGGAAHRLAQPVSKGVREGRQLGCVKCACVGTQHATGKETMSVETLSGCCTILKSIGWFDVVDASRVMCVVGQTLGAPQGPTVLRGWCDMYCCCPVVQGRCCCSPSPAQHLQRGGASSGCH